MSITDSLKEANKNSNTDVNHRDAIYAYQDASDEIIEKIKAKGRASAIYFLEENMYEEPNHMVICQILIMILNGDFDE